MDSESAIFVWRKSIPNEWLGNPSDFKKGLSCFWGKQVAPAYVAKREREREKKSILRLDKNTMGLEAAANV